MEEYKIGTIMTGLIAAIGVLWHQLLKQININRDDQKEYSEGIIKTIGVIAENTEERKETNRRLKNIEEKQNGKS